MLNNIKGFSMIDALLGVSVLTLFFSLALPSINTLIKERKLINERMFVMTTLHNDLQHLLYDDYNNIKTSDVIISPTKKQLLVTRIQKNEEIEVCISWNITNTRKEELCLYGHQAK